MPDATELPRLLCVGRAEERRTILGWRSKTRTSVHWIHGPAGIGKTALLRGIASDLAHAGARATSVNALVRGAEGALRDALFGKESFAAGGRVVLIDNADASLASEIGALPAQGLLVIIASRQRPPAGWNASADGPALVLHRLQPLRVAQGLELLARIGVEDPQEALAIFRASAGQPFALDCLSRSRGAAWGLAPVAAEIARELSLPSAREALDALACLGAGNEDAIADVLGGPVPTEVYEALLALSFVDACPDGLGMEPAQAALLRRALRERSGRRAEALGLRALRVLIGRAERGGFAARTRVVHQVLALKEMYAAPGDPRFEEMAWAPWTAACARDEDLPAILRLADAAAPEVPPAAGALLLGDLLEAEPGAFQLVRDGLGEVRAMQLLLSPESTAPKQLLTAFLGERAAGQAQEALGAGSHLRLFRALDPDASALDAEGLEGILAAALLGTIARHRSCHAFAHSDAERGRLARDSWVQVAGGSQGRPSLHALDLRAAGLSGWLAGFMPDAPAVPDVEYQVARPLRAEDAAQALRHLHHLGYLTEFAKERGLGLSGEALRDFLLGMLIAERVSPPLTREHQRLLRLTYMERPGTVEAITSRLAMSRTTYYRQLAEAQRCFGLSFGETLGRSRDERDVTRS